MFSIFYNVLLFVLGLIALPRILWQWCILGKYRESLKERFGYRLPSLSFLEGKKVIWIHTVSVGETRAVISLFKKLKEKFPEGVFIVSSVTETGHAEALRSLSEADAHFFLPLDFSWVIRQAVNKYRPHLLILVESDFWYHLLKYCKKIGTKIVLVNGKISERSTRRFCFVSSFAKRLFSHFDLLCVQNCTFQKRFSQLGVDPKKIVVTGNLKLDAASSKLTPMQIEQWRQELGILRQDRVVVIGSTHAPEEEWLLAALDSVWEALPSLKVILVPRHPERFKAVAAQLKARGISLISYTEKDKKTARERLILIDAMGLLHSCYQLAEVAIVGGSFIDSVGGHNVFEPIECGIPVLFGPHMEGQPELSELVLRFGAGEQVKLTELPGLLLKWLQHPKKYLERQQAARRLSQEVHGSVDRTLEAIFGEKVVFK